jgi:hypothetical protein
MVSIIFSNCPESEELCVYIPSPDISDLLVKQRLLTNIVIFGSSDFPIALQSKWQSQTQLKCNCYWAASLTIDSYRLFHFLMNGYVIAHAYMNLSSFILTVRNAQYELDMCDCRIFESQNHLTTASTSRRIYLSFSVPSNFAWSPSRQSAMQKSRYYSRFKSNWCHESIIVNLQTRHTRESRVMSQLSVSQPISNAC